LFYAGRARNITNDPRVNEDGRSALIKQLRQEIESLKMEVQYWKGLGSGVSAEGGIGEPRPIYIPGGQDSSELGDKLYEAVKLLESLVNANSNLRLAFDKVAEMKRVGDTTIQNLNIENATLRERIEMLESIVTSSDMDEHTTSSSQRTPNPKTAVFLQPRKDNNGQGLQPTQRSNSNSGPRRSANSLLPPGGSGSLSMQKRLQMYNDRFRNPKSLGNYQKAMLPAQRGNVTDNRQLVSGIIPDVSQHLVPPSLLGLVGGNVGPRQTSQVAQQSQLSSFGALAFGGAPGDIKDLEQRRREREQKRALLDQQHALLQQSGSGYHQYAAAGTFVSPYQQPNYAPPPPPGLQQSTTTSAKPDTTALRFDESKQHFTPEQLAILARRGNR